MRRDPYQLLSLSASSFTSIDRTNRFVTSAKKSHRKPTKESWGWFVCGILILSVVAAYQSTWHAGFIWDDDLHLTRNLCIVGPLGLREIWTTGAAIYYPLVLTNFWIQHALWGLNPLPYHLVNVAMHAGSAILLWRVLLGLEIKGAWLGAAMWALHPVQVESVAWITELKNTQSCLFYLLSTLFFLKWRQDAGSLQDRHRTWTKYAVSFLCAIAAILSKSSTVMLPIVLALCWWWMDGRWRWRNAIKLIPFLCLSLAAAAWTIWEQKFHSQAVGAEWNQTAFGRLIIAGRVLWFYLGKLLWPHPLMFIYPRWKIDASQPLSYLPALAAIFGLIALWWKRNNLLRPLFFAFAYFSASLFPVLGFFDLYFFRYSFVGDHFQYLASMGPLALTAAGITVVLERIDSTIMKLAVCGALLLVLGALSSQQARVYVSADTLWRDALKKNPNSEMVETNYALQLAANNRAEEALQHLEHVLQLNPDIEETQVDVGCVLRQLGRAREALPYFQRGLELNPRRADSRYFYGRALLESGRTDEAVTHLVEAVKIDRFYAPALAMLGQACLQQGRLADSLKFLQEALRLEANDVAAHCYIANTLLHLGQIDEAVSHLRTALSIQPNDPDAQKGMAWVLATSPDSGIRDGAKAVVLAEQANQTMQDRDPTVQATLAAAYAEVGRFPEAIRTAQRAHQLAMDLAMVSFARAIETHLEFYHAQRPFRDIR
jgi:protein O-mannosyl-transferase